jgi:hypothetical protein
MNLIFVKLMPELHQSIFRNFNIETISQDVTRFPYFGSNLTPNGNLYLLWAIDFLSHFQDEIVGFLFSFQALKKKKNQIILKRKKS